MLSKSDTAVGHDCDDEVRKPKSPRLSECELSLAEHVKLLLTRTLESLPGLTGAENPKIIMKIRKYVGIF